MHDSIRLQNIRRAILPIAALIATRALPGLAQESTETLSDQFLNRTRQLTFEGRRAGEGYFKPNGSALIFQSEREPDNPFYQIYILDLTNGETHRVSPGHGKTTCAFFRPGTSEVLFASTHLDPEAKAKQQEEFEFRESGQSRRYSWDYDPEMDIFSANEDGTEITQLTDAFGYDAEGAYSPDGSRIVFCSLRSIYEKSELTPDEEKTLEINPSHFGDIYIMDADGSNVQRLTNVPGYDGGPFFSLSGDRIVWRRFNEKGDQADIYTMKTDGSDVQRLTSFNAMSWAPYYHPSEEYIIFASNKLGYANFELFLVDAQGEKEPLRVTYTDGFDGLPVFAPNGAELVWTSNRTSSGRSQLFRASWDHDAALAAISAAPERNASSDEDTRPFNLNNFQSEISEDDMRRDVEYLASDALEGRMTGSPGAQAAAEYIAQRLEQAGLEPAGTDGWLHSFEFTQGAEMIPDSTRFSSKHADQNATRFLDWEAGIRFQPLGFSANGTAEGTIVFGGYGLALPDSVDGAQDPFAGADVEGKVVLLLRYSPEDVEPKRKAELNRYAGLYHKAKIAQERGAAAVIFVTGPNSPNAGELIPISSDASAGDMIAISVTEELANQLLLPTGKTIGELQTGLDQENPHAENGFEIPGVSVEIEVALKRLRKSGRNVVGWIPPANGDSAADSVILGGHYDHLGRGERGSLHRKDEQNEIHNGADDNASGVSILLELAEDLATKRAEDPDSFQRGVLFAFWSGEEIGLIGSARYVENPPSPLESMVAYLNFDMVGRLTDNKLSLQGVGSADNWRGLIERRNVLAGFDLSIQEDPYLPTDATSFYAREIPILSFFTGSHEDYHRPTDDPNTLNYEGMKRIAGFSKNILQDLVSNRMTPEFVRVERSPSGGMQGLRVYLGTIPDYAAEVEGLRLNGVRAGGPADKAGLQGGDVVIEFAGITVKNIEDYMVAFNAVKIGEPAPIIVLRDNQRTELSIVPEGRE